MKPGTIQVLLQVIASMMVTSSIMKVDSFTIRSNHQRQYIQTTTTQSTSNHRSNTRLFSLKTEPGHVDASVITDGLLSGLSKMEKIMQPKFFDQSGVGSLKQLNSQIVKSLEVKKSTIPDAGLGLFATKNIKAGSIVSFYPAHTLGVEHGDEFLFVSHKNDEYFQQHPPDTSSYLHATDQPIFNRDSILAPVAPEIKKAPVYLDVNPNLPVSPAWVSHYINDGATMQENSVAGVEDYYLKSKAKKNCIHIPFGPSPIIATVATKKIKKGEELFTSYGCVYWIGAQYRQEESAVMTKQIQQQIKESAQDLFAAMKSVSIRYAGTTEALEILFDEI